MREVELEIRPFEGMGPVDFGMTLAEIVERVGEPDRSPPEWERCQFLRLGLLVDLDEQGRCAFIESYHPPAVPVLRSLRLVGRLPEVESTLAAEGLELVRVEWGNTILPEVGVSLWTEDDEDEIIQAVGVGPPSYFDSIVARARSTRTE